MKKILLVLIALMGIGFGAKAQSCDVGNDTYVAVNAYVDNGKIVCSASYYGSNVPTSGTVYATVYYVNKNGNEDYEMITINWSVADNGKLYRYKNRSNGVEDKTWKGSNTNVETIRRWEVSAGACRIERN